MTAQTPLAVLLSPRRAAVQAARRVGARTLVLVPDPTPPEVRGAVGDADEVRVVDWTDHPRLLRVLRALTGQAAPVSVFGFTEASALIAARANEALRFPGNPHAAVAYLTDKAALRGKVNQLAGAPVRFEHCDRAAQLPAVAERVGFPCVAKPRTGAGGQDVRLLRSTTDAALLAAELAGDPALIVEEFLEGPEYSVEAHSHHGRHTVLAVARKYTTGSPGFTEVGYDIPAALDPGTESAIHELVTATLTTAGHLSGPSQTEVVVTPRGPRLIESHAHPGGDYMSDLLARATGTDLVALTVATRLGLPVPATGTRRRHAGIRFLHLPFAGLLERVDGLDEARALPGVDGVEVGLPTGSDIPAATSRASDHGHIAAVAAGPEELASVLRKAHDALRPVIAPAQREVASTAA